MSKNTKYLALFKENTDLLLLSKETLSLFFIKCKKIGLKAEYTFEESESFDSLSSKFARTADIFTQKVLKTFFIIVGENPETFIDKANYAEKLHLIPSAEMLKNIRFLRNDIAHEYIPQNLIQLYEDVLSYTYELLLILEHFEIEYPKLITRI